MTITKITLCLATLALGIASAASTYNINLASDTMAGATKLKAGDYKLQVEGNQAIFKQGKNATPVPVTVETSKTTFPYTAVNTDGPKLLEIDLRGTHTKLVFAPAPSKSSVSTE